MQAPTTRRTPQATQSLATIPGMSQERPRILLAEDDAALRALLAGTLRREGFEVDEVHDGLELFARIEAEVALAGGQAPAISLVVSDIRMPGLSGLEVLSILRCGFWDTPVILLTAFGDEHTHEEARQLRATRVFDKPFDLGDFRRAVRAAVQPC